MLTANLDLEELLEYIAEADYEGKITEPVTYISTRVMFHAEEDVGILREFRAWNI